nr:hypothetical protein [uncultured Chitinophaga sp.]
MIPVIATALTERDLVRHLLLNGRYVKQLGLGQGKAGLMLAFAARYLETEEDIYLRVAGEYIEDAVTQLNTGNDVKLEDYCQLLWAFRAIQQQGIYEDDLFALQQDINDQIVDIITGQQVIGASFTSSLYCYLDFLDSAPAIEQPLTPENIQPYITFLRRRHSGDNILDNRDRLLQLLIAFRWPVFAGEQSFVASELQQFITAVPAASQEPDMLSHLLIASFIARASGDALLYKQVSAKLQAGISLLPHTPLAAFVYGASLLSAADLEPPSSPGFDTDVLSRHRPQSLGLVNGIAGLLLHITNDKIPGGSSLPLFLF